MAGERSTGERQGASRLPAHILSDNAGTGGDTQNRFYFSPHGIALTLGNKPTADYVAYNAPRARVDADW